jgi:hypothetical protein
MLLLLLLIINIPVTLNRSIGHQTVLPMDPILGQIFNLHDLRCFTASYSTTFFQVFLSLIILLLP